MNKKRLFSIVFLVFLFLPIYADTLHFSPETLENMGIGAHKLHIANFSADNKTFFAFQEVNNPHFRAKGFGWILRIFNLNPGRDLSLSNTRSMLLPFWNLENLDFSDDGKTLLVASQFGTRVLEINIPHQRVKTVFTHKAGESGFRCNPVVIFHYGNFYTDGYFYDAKGYFLHHAVVQLDLTHPFEPAFFHETINLDALEVPLGKTKFAINISGNERFFTIQTEKSKLNTLYYYKNGQLTVIDSGLIFGNLWATDHRIIYSVVRTNKSREILIKDVKIGKTWKVAFGKPYYYYTFLSKIGGKTAILTRIDFKSGLASFFYGEESEGFKLHPIPDLQKIPFGVFRLSPDGTHYAFLNRNGLFFGTISNFRKENLHLLEELFTGVHTLLTFFAFP